MCAAENKTNPIPEAVVPRVRGKVPRIQKIPPKRNFAFSFEYWQQRDFFGLSCEKVDAPWFVSVLDQLALLSKEEIETVIRYKRDALRFHEIDWNAKNIPIKKSDINWLHPEISLDELEICQVHISKGMGRIVGFFDDRSVFCVLLLDPMHNLQPSSYNDYKIRPTAALKNSHEVLLNKLMHLHHSVSTGCGKTGCEVGVDLAGLLNVDPSQKYICIDELLSAELDLLYDTGYSSVETILIDAIDLLAKARGISTKNN